MPATNPEIIDPMTNAPVGGNNSNRDVDEYAPRRRFMSYREDVWLYWVRVFFLVFSCLATLAVVTVYMWHLVAPTYWRWLADIEISKLKDLALTIIVGLIMSATTTYFLRKK